MSVFQAFEMERMMSRYEQGVDYNLSESGVHPLSLGEILDQSPGLLKTLLSTRLNYPHVEGIPELRERVAALYPSAVSEQVLVTVGAIEANYVTVRTLLSPGDQIVVILPNYLQIWGIGRNHGLEVRTVNLLESDGWKLDLEGLDKVVDASTRVIAVCNPNNPTGSVLSRLEMEAIVAAANRFGAWILADEVYRGSERNREEETPSFVGLYERVVATGSMSKAYGLPGLRLGWLLAPEDLRDEIWARHEYVAISAGMLANQLAAAALSVGLRSRLIDRTRGIVREGYQVLEGWLLEAGAFSWTPPEASAIAFIRHHFPITSEEFVARLRRERGVLIVPGEQCGMAGYLRIGFGTPVEHLKEGLSRIGEFTDQYRSDLNPTRG